MGSASQPLSRKGKRRSRGGADLQFWAGHVRQLCPVTFDDASTRNELETVSRDVVCCLSGSDLENNEAKQAWVGWLDKGGLSHEKGKGMLT